MIETGQILQERYRIDRQIGQGGMGAVYVATDERFGSTVAIKETLCMDDNYRKAIEREARLLNSLKHNALPRVTDHFLESNGQFLVMEYIPGHDLCCILEERDGPFEVEQVLEWADQLLEALDFLHNQENPVIHRDIKPQNLKVTPDGQIILLDFGLAKGNVTGAGNQTNAKSIFGFSRNYASLEQIQGTGTDPRSDLYSLSATLFHLLTKEPPEDALTRAMSVLSQKPDPLVPANQLRPEIPAGVAAIIYKALDLDAAERPATANEMRSMLRSHPEYAGLAVNTVSVARSNSVDIHSQPTQLMPGATMRGRRPTNGETAIVDDDGVSQLTAVRPHAGGANTGGVSQPGAVNGWSKKRTFVAVAGGIVLTAGLGFAGVLAFQEMTETRGERDPIPVTVVETQAVASANDSNPSVAAEVPEPAAEAGTVETVSSEPARAETVQPKKQPQTARTKPQDPLDELDNLDDEKVVVKGDSIYVGNIRMKDGKIYMPDGTVYDQPRRPRVPGAHQPAPPQLTPEQMQRLSPEQRRRLRIIQENFQKNFPQPTPPPEKKSGP